MRAFRRCRCVGAMTFRRHRLEASSNVLRESPPSPLLQPFDAHQQPSHIDDPLPLPPVELGPEGEKFGWTRVDRIIFCDALLKTTFSSVFAVRPTPKSAESAGDR